MSATTSTGAPHRRSVIVNADDFGRSTGINQGVVQAHEQGIVTSASLMVRWPAALEAAGYARERPALSVGLHIDVGEWRFLEGGWEPVYEVLPERTEQATRHEIRSQLERFRAIMGMDPTHLDSHQHVHREEPIRSIVMDLGAELGIPVREILGGISYLGDFYGQTEEGETLPEALTVENLLRIVTSVPEGVTEIGTHPGKKDGHDLGYQDERRIELAVLCDKRVRKAIEEAGIELRSFRNTSAR